MIAVGQQRYHVRCLPTNFPGWDFEPLEDPSHKFYSVASGVRTTTRTQNLNPYVVVFDQHGVPVWWQHEPLGTLGGQMIEYKGAPYIYGAKKAAASEALSRISTSFTP